MICAKNSNIDLTTELLKYNVDVDAKDNGNNTAIIFAAKNQNIFIVKLLLKHNANIHHEDKYKKSGLEYLSI